MKVIETGISGLVILEPNVFEDERGYFMESFNIQTLKDLLGIEYSFIQDNQSKSKYGVIRGLHFQNPPHDQVKLVRCIQGEILDVAVDIRKGSPTYGKHHAVKLTSENKQQLLIPAGFAHGFSVLSDTAEILYKCSALYDKESEGGLLYNDPDLKIDWQLPADAHIISDKDQKQPEFRSFKSEFI